AHNISMKKIILCVCITSLVLGYPVPDSHSDSSQNVEDDSRSSESSLRSSEQQYDSSEETAVDQQTDEISGGLHESTVDQDYISAPIDSIDIEEQLTGIGDGGNQEDVKPTHSGELQSSQEDDKERESTDHVDGGDVDDEDNESGSLEDTLDTVTT
ncbi:hypothetical protein AB205_0099120, partial [Aquarana catesbeiana]